MAREPVRLRAAALSAAVVLLAAGCTGVSSRDTTGDPTTGSSASGDDPTQPGGQVGTGGADYVDPDQGSTPVPTPDPAGQGLDDPSAHGLSAAEEAAALAAATEFVNTIWTWDYTDSTDRAGLIRALPMTTQTLREQLQPLLQDPLYDPQEWADLAAAGQVGSASEVFAAGPAPYGAFNASTYTAQAIYRTFTLTAQGYFVARQEEARYATLELTKSPEGTWLVSAIPHLEAEQFIDQDRP